MPKGVKEFGSCKATTKIVLLQIKQILCLVIHPEIFVCDGGEFFC